MTLQRTRHRLATLRNDLHAELANLKTSSSAFKNLKNRIGGVMDCIEICDQELLAEEGGRAQHLGRLEREALQAEEGELDHSPNEWAHRAIRCGLIRPDQVAWLTKRKGDV